MSRYACMLRAVNVSGARKMNMGKLRDLCVSLGCTEVETYLQSGNVVLRTKKAAAKLGPALSAAVRNDFGYDDVDVLVWTADELAALIAANPLIARGCDPSKLHVTFLAADPSPSTVASIGQVSYPPDEFAMGVRAVYVHCPNGYGRTKLNNSFFERKLGVHATTRNWQTVNNLHALAARAAPT